MSVVRRLGLVEPGTALLLADSSLFAPQRLSEFSKFSGIAPENLLISPLCSVPLPLYNFARLTPGTRRWVGTKPEAMWHPLLWLPNRLAGRYTYPDPDTGEMVRETDAVWTIRACLELTASGLYDVETGTWVDVMAASDLDVTNDVDLGRIEEWLDGEPDELLDAVDLGQYLTIEPHDWALADALTLLEPVTQAAWALTADEIYGEAQTLADPGSGADDAAITAITANLCATAMVLLREVPLVTDGGIATAPTTEEHGAFFYRAYQAVEADNATEAVVAAVLDAISDRCLTLREAYWPSLEALHSPPQEVTV